MVRQVSAELDRCRLLPLQCCERSVVRSHTHRAEVDDRRRVAIMQQRRFLCSRSCVLVFVCVLFLFSSLIPSCNADCHDKNMEEREEMANVVFSGTVKKVMADSPDDNKSSMYKGEIEIKRVFKGNDIVNEVANVFFDQVRNHKMVMVDGFGDPHICESKIHSGDTKIFMLNKGYNGELRLNSSIMPITLTNLEYTEAVVKHKPFKPVEEPKRSPCETYFCAFGAVCMVELATTKPYCQCQNQCPTVFAPVCGTDNVTYASECLLEKASCVQQKRIKVKQPGVCGKQNPCHGKLCKFGATCHPSLDGSEARCQCPDQCYRYGDNVGSKPVCGSDGSDYPNMCEMKKAACNKLMDIRVKYYGKCDPCEGFRCESPEVCQVDDHREPKCQCKFVCLKDLAPVCGTDGKTYSNKCVLEMAACKQRKNIQILYNGECTTANNPCDNVKCRPMEECSVDRNGQPTCKCPDYCEPVLRYVCGNDSVTYDSECVMKKSVCNSPRDDFVVVHHQGQCGHDVPCKDYTCEHNAVCQVHNNKPECVCPQCSEEYRPVCGNNGITYENECKMRQENCEMKTNVRVKQRAPCYGCGSLKCEFYAVCENDGDQPRCVCPTKQSCRRGGDVPVCGSDSQTYQNECQMKVESCRRKQIITISSTGSCEKCYGVMCKFGAKCENGVCVCPILCSTLREAVCGSDGQTYINECEMRKSACLKEMDIEVAQDGDCDIISIPSGSGEYCHCNAIGSYGPSCDPVNRQCSCKPSVGGLRCDRCEIGYWGLHKIADAGNSGCIACNCNRLGSERDDCDQMHGRCVCKALVSGMKCDRCSNGQVLGPRGCDEWYRPTSCDEVECQYGALCQLRNDGTPECVCDLSCDNSARSQDIVCGSDNQNYGSECQLKMFACRLGTEITVAYRGPCRALPPVRTTMPPPSTSRSRKTTRHIQGETPDDETPMSSGTHKPDLRERDETCDGSYIDGLCLEDDTCCSNNSHCKLGLCRCLPGYVPSVDNRKCIEVKKVNTPFVTLPPEKDACADNPCYAGGQCEVDELLGFRCTCPLGRAGPLCNKQAAFRTPSFSGRSFIEVPRIEKANEDLSIEVVFDTLNKDGIILFNAQNTDGTGDFVSLAVRDGFIEFRFDLGGGEAVLQSRNVVEPGRSHRVVARRMKSSGILIVDNDPDVTGRGPSTHISLNLNDPLFLGFIPKVSKEIYDRVGVDLGLVGCIHSLRAGTRNDMYTYDLELDTSNSDVLNGADISECGSSPCKSMPCQNGGTCMRLDGDMFDCKCPDGYKGVLCEELVDACASAPCQYGGTCSKTATSEGFQCRCTEGREGTRCERESMRLEFVPQFTGSSYMEIPLDDAAIGKMLTIEVWFRPLQPNGVIFWATQFQGGLGDFISLNLVRKRLQFKYYLGSGVAMLQSKRTLHLDKWHKVVVSRDGRDGQMSINSHPAITGQSPGTLTQLNLDPALFVGGFNNRKNIPKDSGIETGFTGAIQRVIINGHTVDNLMKATVTMSNITGYNGPPCNVNPCMNGGVCIPILNSAECRCPYNYMGQHCEKRAEHVDKDQPVRFEGNTYLDYPSEVKRKNTITRGKVPAQRTNEIKVNFKTTEPNGMILFQNKGDSVRGDYLAVAVVRGRVEFSYNLGQNNEDDLHVIRSKVEVTDGQWHTVTATRNLQEGTLQVGSEIPVKSSSGAGSSQLDTDGELWVGGRSSLPWGLPQEYYQGFIGCIRRITVNGEQLHLVDHRNGHSSTIAFCS